MSDTSKNFISIKELFEEFLSHIKLFIVSAVVCVGAAVVYIVVTPPSYERKATIMIKEDTKGNSMTSESMQTFEGMGLLKQNSNINNEIEILQTPVLMEEVVARLGLDYNYGVMYKHVRQVDLYNGTPVTVRLDSLLHDSRVSFDIEILPDSLVSISKLKVDGEEFGGELVAKLRESIHTPLGAITVKPTRSLNIWTGKTILFSRDNIKKVAAGFSSRLKVQRKSDDTSIVEMSITDVVPRRAEDILNTLISVYNENWIKDKNLVTLSTSEFIDARLGVIEKELGGVDEDISAYKSENLLPDVNAVSNMYLAQSEAVNTKQLTLNNQLSMARYIKKYMEDATTRDQLLPSNTGIDNRGIETLIEKYNTLLLEKNNLLANSSEGNPLVADITQNLVSIRQAINLSIDDLINTLLIQIDNARDEERQNKEKIATNPNQAKYLLTVERQQKVKNELYLFLLQKREENELSQAFTAYNTRILTSADGKEEPVAPRRLILLLAALVAGLLIPTVYLLIRENFNTLVRSKKDLAGLTIPFLGIIPLVGKRKKKRAIRKESYTPVIVVEERSRNVINEAFRVLRTNLDFMSSGNSGGKVVMLTSFHPGSGKSFISSNLAMSMAIKGSRVVLIDTDMRKASLSTYVNSPSKGLSGYLNGNIRELDSIIVRGTLHTNLDVIPVGAIPPNPAELLLTTRFEELIADMRTKYDYIFLDCTPVDIVSDASIAGRLCDTTMFIVRAGLLDKRMIPDLEKIYLDKKFNNMCTVLNAVEYRKTDSYHKYGYYGYGGYHGYYGNGEDEGKK